MRFNFAHDLFLFLLTKVGLAVEPDWYNVILDKFQVLLDTMEALQDFVRINEKALIFGGAYGNLQATEAVLSYANSHGFLPPTWQWLWHHR